MSKDKLQSLKGHLEKIWGHSPAEVIGASAPGRVNLIGEHTDYNDGFVLPAAVNLRTYAVGRKRNDQIVNIFSFNVGEKISLNIPNLQPPGKAEWWTYLAGPLYVLKKRGVPISGCDVVVDGEVPLGGGLSSSASAEVSTLALYALMFNLHLDPLDMAQMARQAENEFSGVPCGIMDQMASVLGQSNKAIFIDCRTLETRFVPIPDNWKVVVCDTRVRHKLASSQYATRQQECREAVEALKRKYPNVKALRDATLEMLYSVKDSISSVVFKRAKYVIEENARVKEAVEALLKRDRGKIFNLFKASHEGLRFEFEVSCRELDVLAEAAWQAPGIIGARMTGGGFGGNTVNLVESGLEKAFVEHVREIYKRETGIEPEIKILQADQGVKTWKLT